MIRWLKGTRRVQRCLTSCLLGVVVLLSACGGGGGDDAAAPDDESRGSAGLAGDDAEAGVGIDGLRVGAGPEFFPLNVGDHWVYRTADDGLVKFSVTGRERVGSVDTTIVSHNVPGYGVFERVHFAANGRALRQVPGPDASPLMRAIGPLDVMHFPLVRGDRFVQVDTTVDSGVDVDGDGRTDPLTRALRGHRWSASSSPASKPACTRARPTCAPQIVQTLAGTAGGAPSTLTATLDDWYAPGVGLVRSRGLYREGEAVQNTSQTLLAYRLSGRRSDYQPPRITATDPAPDSVHGSRTIVSIDFSEPIDADSFVDGAVSIVDASGRPVFGYFYLDAASTRLSFYPSLPWQTGRYTVQVQGATLRDLAGNALRARSWGFDIEGDAPTVVSFSPARDADDVALDVVLRAQFSEALDSRSVQGNVRLLDDAGDEVAATVSLVDPVTLTIRPLAPLQRATRYHVHFGALTDLLGNPVLSNQPWSFRTDPGAFSYPTLISPHWAPEAVAVGDVNGDGLDDVVMSTYFSFDPENDFKLVVYLQRADGTLAEPVRYANASHYQCKAGSLAIADLDGDGRKDVAIGESGCGIEIFIQQADGTLASGNWLPSTESHRVRAADVNGDGLADLVGTGADSGQLSVWYQVGGRISLPSVYPVEIIGGGDLDVGDLNGDGRPDIAVSSLGGSPARSIGMLYQQADGRYAAPVYLGVDASWGARGVAIGDLNGDGRKDLAVSWGGSAPAAVSVFPQRADGTLGPITTLASSDYPGAIEIADLNRDGRLDVVVAHDGWGSVGLYLQGSNGGLQDEQRYTGTDGSDNLQGLALGDLNGDGRLDIAQAGLSVLYGREPRSSSAAAMSARMKAGGAQPLRWWSGVAGRAVPAAEPAGPRAR